MDYKKLNKEELQKLAQEAIVKCKKGDLINFLKSLEPVKSKAEVLKPIIELIDDSGIVEKHSNGGRTKTIIFKCNDKYWRLIIHSESYDFQSYIRLYSSTTLDNWTLIKSGNPKKDYNISVAYRNDCPDYIFNGIIEDYKEIIKKMS